MLTENKDYLCKKLETMTRLLYYCFLLLICESSWAQQVGQDSRDMSITFSDPSEKSYFLTFLNLKKVPEPASAGKLPDFRVDEYSLYKVRVSPSISFSVYVGLDMNARRKFISIDTDFNNDFSNDSIFEVSLDDYAKYSLQENPMGINTKIRFAYSDNGEQKMHTVPVTIYPFYSDKRKESYATETDYFLDIGLLGSTAKESIFSFEGINYKAYATQFGSELYPWKLSPKTAFNFFRTHEDEMEAMFRNCAIGDTILLSDKKMTLTSVDGNKLLLQEVGDLKISQGVNNSFPDVYVHSLQDDQLIKVQDLIQDKYVFIDFWGSWCQPCIHSIPLIKQLSEKVKGRSDVAVLGIALEKAGQADKLKAVIKDKQISYDNYIVYRNEEKQVSSPHLVWQVYSFPTYLILDKKGKVVFKIDNSMNTEKAISTFLELIGD